MEKILNFLKPNFGSGNGSGSGDGDGYGDGYGNGSGYGDGYGYGNGNGDIISIYNNIVHIIDNINTIIYSVHNNYAKAAIINNDLTLTSCYIAKICNYFAHGETLKQARNDVIKKYNSNLPEEERINKFLNNFNLKKKYSAKLFYDWHTILTGSCTLGKDHFLKENNIELSDKFTVLEFLELTKNNYGESIINNIINKI